MAKRKAAIERAPDMRREHAKFFDATFTSEERSTLRSRIIELTGLKDYCIADFKLFRPIEREIGNAIGWSVTREVLEDYVLIKISRDLEIDYKSFARNKPKLPIDTFLQLAKAKFPEFKKAKSTTVRIVQRDRLWMLWTDWIDLECERRGCENERHWMCTDKFVAHDLDDIADDIAAYNATRPRLIESPECVAETVETPFGVKKKNLQPKLRLVHSAD